jgi:putative phosphoribosyl transferase
MRELDGDAVAQAGMSPQAIEAACFVENLEVARRERECRGCAAPPLVRRRVVILVDDGLTPSVLPHALSVLRAQRPSRLVVALPAVVRAASTALWQRADEVATLAPVDAESDLAAAYEDVEEPSDEVVRDLLLRATRAVAVKGANPTGSPR